MCWWHCWGWIVCHSFTTSQRRCCYECYRNHRHRALLPSVPPLVAFHHCNMPTCSLWVYAWSHSHIGLTSPYNPQWYDSLLGFILLSRPVMFIMPPPPKWGNTRSCYPSVCLFIPSHSSKTMSVWLTPPLLWLDSSCRVVQSLRQIPPFCHCHIPWCS